MAKKKSKTGGKVVQQMEAQAVEATSLEEGSGADGQTVGAEGQQPTVTETRKERSAREASTKKVAADPQNAPSDATPAGYVRRSTLYISIIAAMIFGLYMGALLPMLMVHSVPADTAAPAPSAPASPGAISEQEQKLANLAGHIQELETAVRKNAQDVKAWIQLGNLYFDTGKHKDAINAYEKALLLEPENADVLTDLGIMYRETGRYELAVQSFRKAAAINPKHQNALFNTGIVLYYDLGRKEEARKVWHSLLAINPNASAPNGKPLSDLLRELK